MAGGVVILNAKLKRDSDDVPWGFRLVGGADQKNHPHFVLERITEGSLAAKAGLEAGDVIFIVNDQPLAGLTHQGACEVINAGQDTLIMRIKRLPKPRGGIGASSMAKDPHQNKGPSIIDQVAKGASQQAKLLAKSGQPSFIVEVAPNLMLSHTQPNTPLNMYSEGNIEESISTQLNDFITKNPKFDYLKT